MNKEYMKEAIRLAWEYTPSPNPRVGCVIVKDHKIIGSGAHTKAGTPHAEINAINSANCDLTGSEMYVTLEPCSHYGKTPPCADVICNTGIKKVYIGMVDCDNKVCGNGVKKLESSGIEVVTGVCEEECAELNKGYIKHRNTNMPYVILKSAMTLDGKVATKTGDSKWITNSTSRAYVHEVRSKVDAVLVGGGTLRIDNPTLNARLKDSTIYPAKIVITNNIVDYSANIFKTPSPVYLVSLGNIGKLECVKENNGVCDIYKVKASDFKELFKYLASIGIMAILVEGGAEVSGSILSEKLVDEVMFFYAPKILGDKDSKSSVVGRDINNMVDTIDFKIKEMRSFDGDFLIIAVPEFK